MRRARKPQRGSDRISAPATRAASQRNDTAQEPSGLPAVQRAAGNFAIQRQCACGGSSGGCATCAEEEGLSLQTKLTVNEPGDAYEREADSVADRVTAPSYRAAGAPRISHLPASGIGQSAAASETVQQAVSGSGGALDPAVRGEMEQRFGRDFSGVRVHTDPNAVASARALSARAYTVGADIVFDRGHYAPQSSTGKRLLAHELTHVVQQSGGKSSAPGKAVQRDWRDDLASDMARDLKNHVENNPKPYAYLLAFFRKISPDMEDNVAAAFVKLLKPETLESFAADPEGLKVLDVLTQAMITGDVSKFESEQAEKILVAKRAAVSTLAYMAEARQLSELRHEAAPGFSDDDRASQLAKDLNVYIANDLFRYVILAFDDISAKIEDNVAAAILETLSDARLAEIAEDSRGREMLDVLYEAMITGDVSSFEALQSERIALAKAPHISSVKFRNTVEHIADLRNEAETSAIDLLAVGPLPGRLTDAAARAIARALSLDAARKNYAAVITAMRDQQSEYEDDIAAYFVELQTPAQLEEIATHADGRALLDVLYAAIMTGDVSDFERYHANRIIAAKSQAKVPPDLASMKEERILVLPVREQRTFRSSYAIIKASLQPDGKVKAYYDNAIAFEFADMFKEDIANLPSEITNRYQGVLLNPDQVVVLKLYDENKKLLPVRAIELIDYANQLKRKSFAVGAKAFEAGLFLGYGGLAAFSSRGVGSVAARVELGELTAMRAALQRGVLWADRVSMVLPLVSLVVDENRDWILEKFPHAGPVLIGALDQANRISNYYGWGRMGFDAARYLKSRLQPAMAHWRDAKGKAGELSPSQKQAVDEIDASLKAIEDDLTKTEIAAGAEASRHVEQNPQLTQKKASGERHAKVGDHEVVEVRGPGGSIHCEFHSNGGPEIPCPAPWVKDPPAPTQPGSATAPAKAQTPEPAPGSAAGKAAAADAAAEAAKAAEAARKAARLSEITDELASNKARMEAAERDRLRAKKKADTDSAAAYYATGKDKQQLLDSVERNRTIEKNRKQEADELRIQKNKLNDEARFLQPPPAKPQTWPEAEDALRTEFGGRKIRMSVMSGTPPQLKTREIDCLTPDLISRESKFGQQTTRTPNVMDEIEKDRAMLRDKKVTRVEWHFYENPISGAHGPNAALKAELEGPPKIFIVMH